MEHLRLADMSDRELLLIMLDIAEDEGAPVDPMDVADVLKIQGEHPRRCVSSRLSWLMRLGAVDKEFATDEHGNVIRNRKGEARTTQRYRLTNLGLRMATGEFRAAQSKALETMDDEQALLVARWLGERQRASGHEVATLLRREWTYRTQFAPTGRRR
jgi:hypothetical protein